MDFEFTTTPENSMQILISWNIRLLESIASNPQKLNEISSVLNTTVMPGELRKGKGRGSISKSFRSSKHSSLKHIPVRSNQDPVRRAGSFSKVMNYQTGNIGNGGSKTQPGSGGGVIRIGGLPPLPLEAGEDGGILSQDSFFVHTTGVKGTPPPLPPRPSNKMRNYDDSDEDDPDYAYIKEDEVKVPNGSSLQPQSSVDDVLNKLEQDIMRDNRVKKQEEKKRRAQTLGRSNIRQTGPRRLGPRVTFPKADPQDYTDFVPSKRSIKSTSSEPEKNSPPTAHIRSISEPEPMPHLSPSRVSQPPPVFESTENIESQSPSQPLKHPDQPPNTQRSGHTTLDYIIFEAGTAPALPPRTWRNTSTSTSSYNSLTSSLTSASNNTISEMSTVDKGEMTPSEEDMSLTSEGVSWNLDGGKGLKIDNPPSPNCGKDLQATPSTIPEEEGGTSRETPKADTQDPSTPPPLPPRSPTKDKLSRKSSTSSTSSTSSNAVRCPRCRSIRKSKTSVGKTVSLDHRVAAVATMSPEEVRMSLPDLADAKSVLENGLGGQRHRHSHRSRDHSHCSKCSPNSSNDGIHKESLQSSSLQNFNYLQLVGEEQPKDPSPSSSSIDIELRPEMDLLNSCLETLEYLEHKVNGTPTSTGAGRVATTVSTSASSSQQVVATSDVRNSVYSQARKEAEIALAELSQPLASVQQSGKTSNANDKRFSMPHDSLTKQLLNGHTPQVTKQNSLCSATTSTTTSVTSSKGHQNGLLHQLKSNSSMGLNASPVLQGPAPPVPPRSVVSLTQPVIETSAHKKLNQTRSTSQIHLQSPPFKRTNIKPIQSISVGHISSLHRLPERSFSAFGLRSPWPSEGHPSMRHYGEEPSQSSTVFIHHIKDRQIGALNHLV